MPGMDGFEMSAIMRRNERNWKPWLAKQRNFLKAKGEKDHLRVVAITAHREHNVDPQ